MILFFQLLWKTYYKFSLFFKIEAFFYLGILDYVVIYLPSQLFRKIIFLCQLFYDFSLFYLISITLTYAMHNTADTVYVVSKYETAESLYEDQEKRFRAITCYNISKTYCQHDSISPIIWPDISLIPRTVHYIFFQHPVLAGVEKWHTC